MRALQEERHALARRRRASAGGLVFDLGHGPGGNPAAGTIISNQAAASYTDGQGVDRVSQSNAVETLVLPKAAFSLASDNTKQASPGSTVYFTHTLTNTGNAADTFKITVDKPANTVGSPASTCDIYIDEDGNGLPDSNTPIGACGTPFTTTSVLAGGLYRFVIGATVNGQASTGDEATIAVHAKSVTDPAATGARAEHGHAANRQRRGVQREQIVQQILRPDGFGDHLYLHHRQHRQRGRRSDHHRRARQRPHRGSALRVGLGHLVQRPGRADGRIGRRRRATATAARSTTRRPPRRPSRATWWSS